MKKHQTEKFKSDCKTCQGSGQVPSEAYGTEGPVVMKDCGSCKGSGQVTRFRSTTKF